MRQGTGLFVCLFFLIYFFHKKKAVFYVLCVSVLVAAVVVGRLLDTSARTVLMKNDLPVPPTPMTYSPKQLGGMPLGRPLKLPLNKQQDAVVEAFQHGWKAYKKYAWGKDELKPISRGSHEWLELGLTLIDSLDTMWLMGLSHEFDEARKWVKEEMVIGVDKDVNLFETTNRIMGGLLSTYHLTQDQIFLDKAKELGDMLLPCFKSPSGIPFSDINLKTGHSHAPAWGPDSSVSEVSTIQLEFRDLSKLTSDLKYQMAVDEVMEKLQSLQKKDDLVPLFINAETGHFTPGTLTLGARADTYYEYLFKQWIQSSKKENRYRQWFLDSMSGVRNRLLGYSRPLNLTFIGEELYNGNFYPKMDHLVCYLPGTLALAAHNGLSETSFMGIAEDLMYTCYNMYKEMPTGLSPEIVHFNMDPVATKDIYVKPLDCHNILRPETVESLFYLYRFTSDTKYQRWGWEILQAFNKYTRLEEGYSSINNVTNTTHLDHRDKMEGLFLGQTLKYLFLLFANDHSIISLDHWVLNTAAHPLPIWDSYYRKFAA